MDDAVEQPLAVLLADNDEDSRQLCREAIARAGIEVATATSGRAALAAAQCFTPRVIIWAVGLPGAAEATAARHFRTDPAFNRTTLIALGTQTGIRDERSLRDAGFDRVLLKPVEPEAVLACVRDALKSTLAS